MKKILSLLLAVLIGIQLIGCGNSTKNLQGDDRQVTASQSDTVAGENNKKTDKANEPAAGKTDKGAGLSIADSYSIFIDTKSFLAERIIGGLSSDPELSLISLDLAGVIMVDLLMIPVSFFGLGEVAAKSGLAVLQLADVEYKESGNKYTLKYKDNDGKSHTFEGVYDEKADWLVCKATEDDQNILNAEYYQTSFGYIAQYNFIDDNGNATTLKISIQVFLVQ